MSEGAPTLELGFAIDADGVMAQLQSVDDAFGDMGNNAVRETQRVERATKGFLNMAPATGQVREFGTVTTASMRSAEQAGEKLVRSLERQNEAFGKSRSELRLLKAEAAAAAAEKQGLTELAARIRATESELAGQELAAARRARFEAEELAEQKAIAEHKAAQQAAMEQANAEKAVIAQLRERARLQEAIERNTGAGRVRAIDAGASFSALAGQAAEMEKNAQAAERLRRATDPLYAATARLNEEIAESTRLFNAGATAPEEYARQQAVLNSTLQEVTKRFGAVNAGSSAMRFGMMDLGRQLSDVSTMWALGMRPMQIFASQAGQIIQSVQMMSGGAGKFASFLMGPWGIALTTAALVFAPLVGMLFDSGEAAEKASGKIRDLSQEFDFAKISAKELVEVNKLLADANRDIERTAIGAAKATLQKAQADREQAKAALQAARAEYERIAAFTSDPMFAEGSLAFGGYLKKAGATPAKIAELEKAIAGLDQVANRSEFNIAVLTAGMDANERKAEDLKEAIDGLRVAYEATGDQRFLKSALRYQEALTALEKGNKTERTAAERRAEQLQRDADATEAQIRNLYALADAYSVSGAEALIAEARAKAESQAIKQRGDITAAVERQIRLEIAQRVSDSAKTTAAMQDQAIKQAEVNALVAAGLEPAERASELVQERLAQLPLLAAREAAAAKGYLDLVEKINEALDKQRNAYDDQRREAATAAFNAATASGNDRLAQLREEMRLIGATDVARARSLAKLQAEQQARTWNPEEREAYVKQQMDIAEEQVRLTQQQNDFNQELRFTADLFDVIHANASDAAQGMADAFGSVGSAMGDALTVLTGYHAAEERLRLERDEQIERAGNTEAAKLRENRLYALRSASLQVGAFGDMAAAAQGFFKEGTDGYRALQTAEKAFRAVEFALSVRAIAQDAIETGASIANSVARTAAKAVEAVVSAISKAPFPLNLAAGAATIAALASIGVAVGGAFGGGGNKPAPANEGRGTVLGDPEAQSQSLKRSLDALREVDLLTATYSREMLGSLRSIDKQIGGFASAIMRTGNVNADLGVQEGFTKDLTGKVLSGLITGGGLFTKIPIIGDILGGIGSLIGSLFGSKKEVVGSGLFAGPQSLAQILGGGFDASYYSDIKKTKKFLGIKTGSSFSTQYTNANPELENQFTLILRSFSDAIAAAAGPLGLATSDIQRRLDSFVVNIGKIDTRNLTGTELQEKLTAVFGAAADRMASTVVPGIERFQQAGEGAFETLVRVASTVETVTGLFDLLGISTQALGLDAKLGVADQFDSLQDLSSATQAYFETFYTREEQAQAKLAQFNDAFDQMGIALPATLAGFRDLVEAQDLTTEAGRQTYAMLLQVAPAFADLQAALNGARSAADILAERQDLQRRLLQLQGNTGALRELELAQIDVSNRALQQQIWAIGDAQEAAKAAEQLRDAWTSVGDSIMDEVRRIRGLTGEENGGGFASLLGQFNAASLAARGGDIDAAKALPGLSQALLKAAELVATSRQELDRVRAQTAASLEATNAAIAQLSSTAPANDAAVLAAAASTQAAATPQAANDDLAGELRALRDEVAQLRTENNAGHAATAGNTGSIKRTLDNVTQQSGGDAIATVAAA